MTKKKVMKLLFNLYLVFSTVQYVHAFIKARGKGKEDDRHLIGKAIDVLAGCTREPDYTVTIEDTVLNVSYNPYVHLFTNTIGCIACIMGANVYTDAQYRRFSENTQYAILCHELGHKKLNHSVGLTYVLNRIIGVIRNEVLPMELEADEYAASIVGTIPMMQALKEMATCTKGVTKKELLLRIAHLKTLN